MNATKWLPQLAFLAPMAIALAVPREETTPTTQSLQTETTPPSPPENTELHGFIASTISTYRQGDLLTRLFISLPVYAAGVVGVLGFSAIQGRTWKRAPINDVLMKQFQAYQATRFYIRDQKPIQGEMAAFLVTNTITLLKECQAILVAEGLTNVTRVALPHKTVNPKEMYVECQSWIQILDLALRRYAATSDRAKVSAEDQIKSCYTRLGLQHGFVYSLANVQNALDTTMRQASVKHDTQVDALRAELAELHIAFTIVCHDLGI